MIPVKCKYISNPWSGTSQHPPADMEGILLSFVFDPSEDAICGVIADSKCHGLVVREINHIFLTESPNLGEKND